MKSLGKLFIGSVLIGFGWKLGTTLCAGSIHLISNRKKKLPLDSKMFTKGMLDIIKETFDEEKQFDLAEQRAQSIDQLGAEILKEKLEQQKTEVE